ncbi:MAG: OmpA family protein, partial [Halioglobus sp.]|nr:OmpA family protein [Halioglobus sp.]
MSFKIQSRIAGATGQDASAQSEFGNAGNFTGRWLGLLVLCVTLIGWSITPPSFADEHEAESTYTFSPRFGTRKTELSASDKAKLDEIANSWRGQSGLRLKVVGHTDNIPIAPRNRKEFASNQVLSEARAKAVAEYLAQALQIPADNIAVVGMGPRQPVASNATAEGRALNRRVDVTLRSVSFAKQTDDQPAVATMPPRGGQALLQRARVLIDQGRPHEALAILRPAES